MKQQPTLIFVRGLPGSGKSYLSDAIIAKIGHDKAVLVDPDAIDRENSGYIALSDSLSSEGLNPAIYPFRWLRKTACAGISSGKTVLWSQPFTNRGVFDRLVLFIKENSTYDGDLRVLLIEVEIDQTMAKQRIEQRIAAGGHGPSDMTFIRRASEYESFSGDYATLSVHGDSAINESVKDIMKALEQN